MQDEFFVSAFAKAQLTIVNAINIIIYFKFFILYNFNYLSFRV
ncbi:hypothetical protein JCM19275_3582 [Nonlabens ulvanivorans]|uniref:Uncharacterized protein n=1 Tax=Nonlabens ulvanivorans TaxID=906888 RepID=A0A090X2R2_NONUL|nr:hypothetical protein JCM19275_3582 [Nonlabens ulvanivorans]